MIFFEGFRMRDPTALITATVCALIAGVLWKFDLQIFALLAGGIALAAFAADIIGLTAKKRRK